MSHKHLPIAPTRVNDSYVRGSLYHWDGITDEDAARLGITSLPGGSLGNARREDGVTCRRLKGGRLNVTIESSSSLMRDPAIRRFMDVLVDPAEHGSAVTVAATIGDAEEAGDLGLNGGTVEYHIESGVRIASPGALSALRKLHRTARREVSLFDYINTVHPDDRPKVKRAMIDAIQHLEPYDILYRIGNGWVRSVGSALRDDVLRPKRIVSVLSVYDNDVFSPKPPAPSEALGGDFSISLEDWSIERSPGLVEIYRRMCPGRRISHKFFDNIDAIHPDDVCKFISNVTSAVDYGSQWDVVYRLRNGAVLRSSAAVSARGTDGRPTRVSGMLTTVPSSA